MDLNLGVFTVAGWTMDNLAHSVHVSDDQLNQLVDIMPFQDGHLDA